VVLDSLQRCSCRKVGVVQEQALDATFSLVKPVDQRLGFSSLLLRDVEVHDILGGVFELAQFLLKTCITIKQLQKHVGPWHIDQLHNNGKDANLGGSLWTSP
jgi:hypothetical protein